MDPSLAFIDPEEEAVGPTPITGGARRTSIITEKPEVPEEEDIPISEVEGKLNQMAKEAAPDADQATINEAKKLAYNNAQSGDAPPGMQAAIEQFSAVGSDPEALKATLGAKNERGDDKSETLGALLAIALPVIVGMAIGGKRGAAAAIEGAGSYYLASKKEERDKESEIEKEERAAKAAQDQAIARQSSAKELIDYRNKAKQEVVAKKEGKAEAARIEKEEKKAQEEAKKKEDWLQNADVETKKNIYSKRAVVDVLANLVPKMRALGNGRLGYTASSFNPGSEAYEVNRQIGILIPRIAKAFGDTGNIAVSEQKIIKDNIFGTASTSGEVADRLENLVETLKLEHDSMLDTLKAVAEGEGGSLKYSEREKGSSSMPTEASIKKNIKNWKASGKSPEAVRKALEKRGIDMPDETFEEFWGAS